MLFLMPALFWHMRWLLWSCSWWRWKILSKPWQRGQHDLLLAGWFSCGENQPCRTTSQLLCCAWKYCASDNGPLMWNGNTPVVNGSPKFYCCLTLHRLSTGSPLGPVAFCCNQNCRTSGRRPSHLESRLIVAGDWEWSQFVIVVRPMITTGNCLVAQPLCWENVVWRLL